MTGPAGHRRMMVGGQWRDAADGAVLEAENPATEEVIGTFPAGTAADVDAAVAAAAEAAPAWQALGWAERARLLRELAGALREERELLARLDTSDGGSPVTAMRADVDGAVKELEYFAGIASQTRGSTAPPDSGSLSYTLRQPYGVVGRIVPYNHPLKFAAGKCAAPLAAGNTVVLKPGEQTSLSALELARITGAILPPGVLNVVTGAGDVVGNRLVAHPDVPRIAFTGSVPTGRAVLHAAADEIKHVSLELGGKNPVLVFPDADPERAARAAVAGMNIVRSTGQSCGSGTRLFVHDDVRGPFLDALHRRLDELRIGDPHDEETEVGPLSFRAHYERVTGLVETARREGATVAYGGDRPAGLDRGYYLRPTVLTDLDDGMTVVREEIFGPVMAVLGWRDVDDVVRRANALPLGLTANIWTNDVSTAVRTAAAVEAGYVYVNGTGRRPTGMPFGGWKRSGLGQENGPEELVSYTREKAVTVTLL
ncbi:Acyl-CoA reductase [Blastococcus sp. DSM 46786]|uniref:aldehyde dehydrogenase family protein n=1 Tax=Blastococcus sp. DSM 46786 TaxID=1798227 RepID=UPI0008B013CD|nr:aldehyde dehydrogenase family protein [Blastococcus sp. DSM 46786]SEK91792.1 Acyl-CoA reductase [Blastococcus sp. DSM 46786]